ncbi:MAG: hypothetical protein GVY17_10905 [Cyanobacteria bacterium]|jgi:hypothetical protein|nr:hypothetical protein [Cyanobacteria bacterium GSL.Bin21]
METQKRKIEALPQASPRIIERIYQAGFRVRKRYRSGKPFYVIYHHRMEKAGFWNRQEACIFLIAETIRMDSRVNQEMRL